MRRGLASLIMGLSLTVASASWAGFVLSHTILDPGRSEALADTLLDNTEVRDVIIDRMADALEAQIPADIPVPRQSLELAASVALDDPRVEALVRDGIVQAHQNALNGVDEPIVLDAGEIGAASRQALVDQVPVLDVVLPEAPAMEVEVPGAGLSWLGTVKDFVDRYTLLGALVALAGVTTAFVLARNRPAALRRVAFWAFGSAAFWLAVGYAIPWLARTLAPSSAVLASASVDVFVGAMLRPALVLAGVGVVLLVASFVWPNRERRRPAAMLDQAARERGRSGGRSRGRGPAAAGGARPIPDRPAGPVVGYQAGPAGFDPSPPVAPSGPYPAPGGPDRTQEYPVISSGVGAVEPVTALHPGESPTTVFPAAGAPAPAPVETAAPPLWGGATEVAPPATTGPSGWVEGVGYIAPGSGLSGPTEWGQEPATRIWADASGSADDGVDPDALFNEAPTSRLGAEQEPRTRRR